jgi:glutaredoxin-related protein
VVTILSEVAITEYAALMFWEEHEKREKIKQISHNQTKTQFIQMKIHGGLQYNRGKAGYS